MAFAVLDRVLVATPTTGTGSIGIGAAVAKYMTFAEAGIANGDTVRYVIEDGNDFEIGTGTYSTTGPTLTRTVIISKISGTVGTSLLNLSGSAVVFATHSATDLKGAITGTGTDFTPGGSILPIAGTTSKAPVDFQSGSLLTTASAGAVEYDGRVIYATPAGVNRGVVEAAQIMALTANYTLTSSTALQKIFNSSANGAVGLQSATTYFWRLRATITGMSATSGDFKLGFGGTATIASIDYTAISNKAAYTTPNTGQMVRGSAVAAQSLVSASTAGQGNMLVNGIVRVTTAGTFIPQVALGVAAAATVNINSSFEIWPIGSNTVATVGDCT